MKAVVVITIGTRDLMFQIAEDRWYNVGDDRMRDGEIIGEQAEVVDALGLVWDDYNAYRHLTQYLFEHLDEYRDRVKPVIVGKLLQDKIADIGQVYLIVTDQKPEIREREKDTLYAGKLIEAWLKTQNSEIDVALISLGQEGLNPANFEDMFKWWSYQWRNNIKVKDEQPLWVCLKGGVGQTAEASRVAGLSVYSTQIQFFEFRQNRKANRVGIPSDYSGPFLGKNYLWDRTQQQAIQMLERFDYAGAFDLLEPYFQQDRASFKAIPQWIEAGILWNQGKFKSFFRKIKNTLNPQQKNWSGTWFWQAYEQAYMAVVRLEQDNSTEAMLHSFRAVEGLVNLWLRKNCSRHIQEYKKRYPQLLPSICSQYSQLQTYFAESKPIKLTGRIQQAVVEAILYNSRTSIDLQAFWSEETRETRNILSHQLGGIQKQEVFSAWGSTIEKQEDWENRILNCLNLLSGQKATSLANVCLFYQVHRRLIKKLSQHSV